MANFELWFQHSISLDEPLNVGDAFRYRGEVWRVAEVDGNRVYLEL
jgi:Lhr-like helicase